MPALETPVCDFGRAAPDFSLPGVDDRTWSLADIRGPRGTLVMFICNHCPYVRAVIDRLVADARVLAGHGVGAVAIMPNDTDRYPDDSPENMRRFAAAHDFGFPYLIDRSQQTARAFGAVCTPDFFGYDATGGLQYRGRLDSGRLDPPPPDAPRDLLDAMLRIADTGKGPADQISSMGCSVKWREAG